MLIFGFLLFTTLRQNIRDNMTSINITIITNIHPYNIYQYCKYYLTVFLVSELLLF